MRIIVKTLALMLVVTSPAWAHDPSCVVVYNNTGTTEGMPVGVFDGEVLLDDVHTSVGQGTLCAVDVSGRTIGAGVLSLYVYQGSAANDPPSTLLVGPVDIVNLPNASQSTPVHFEVPATLVGQDLWIGLGWSGPDGLFAGSNRGAPSLGTSQDVWWLSLPGQTPGFDDAGINTANIYLQVYESIPTPTKGGTWGELKATYR